MKKKYFLVFICALIIGKTWAQTDFSSGAIQLGYANWGTDDLKRFYSDERSLENDFYIVGFSGYSRFGKFISGGDLDMFFSNPSSADGLKTSRFAIDGLINFGYDLIGTDQMSFFPKIGFGGIFYQHTIAPDSNIDASAIATSPQNETALNLWNFLFDFGVGFDVRGKMKDVTKGMDEGKKKAGSIGIRAGYLLGLNSNKWRYGGGEVNNAPSYAPQGFYVKLVLSGNLFKTN